MYGVAILTVLGVHTAGRVGCYCSDIRTDSYTSAAFSYRMVHGDVLYRDMSMDKPPGILVVNTLPYFVLPASRWSLIPMETLLMLLGYWAIYLLGRDLYGPGPALMVTVVASLCINYFSTLDFTGEGFALAESYLILPQVGAVLLYRRAATRKRSSLFVACGVCLGLSLACKQTTLPLFIAIVAHWIGYQTTLTTRAGKLPVAPARTLVGAAWILVGVASALAPFVLMLTLHDTWRQAYADVVVGSAAMLERETGWPDTWRDVTPLWTPMGWIVLAVIVCGLDRWRRRGWVGHVVWWVAHVFRRGELDDRTRCIGRSPRTGVDSTPRHRLPHLETRWATRYVSSFDLTFLLLWLVLECVLLIYLPRRSYHYYVLSFIPVILLSGTFWAVLRAVLEGQSLPGRSILTAALIFWSLAAARPAMNELLPVCLARWKQFDAQADQAHFEHVVRWNNGTMGQGDGKWPGEP